MPEPEKVDASSQPCATGMQEQFYKARLNEQVQRLKKQPPVYQTCNEGSGHQPKFRTTVWVDGVSYTSPNVFQLRRQSEVDAAKFTLFGIMHKLKNEALQHVLEDKTFCKSILVNYCVRMNIPKPTYQTTQSSSPVPIFRSSLVFNDVSYTGDECRTKKEAEQSAARVVILKFLDSETGSILSELIKSMFNHLVTKDTQIAQNDTNVVLSLALNEAKGDEGIKMPYTESLQATTTPAMNPPVDITQTHSSQIPTQTLAPVLTQTPQIPSLTLPQIPSLTLTQVSTQTPEIPTQTHAPVLTQSPSAGTNDAPSIPTQSHVPEIPTQVSTPSIPMPTVSTQTPLTQSTGTNNAPSIDPPVHVTQTHFPQISTQTHTQTTPMPTVQNPFVGTSNAATYSAPSVADFAKILATAYANVIQQGTNIPAMNMPVTHIPEVSVQPPTQTYPTPTVMAETPTQAPTPYVVAQTSTSGTNSAPISTSPSSGQFATIPVTHPSDNVVQPKTAALAPPVTVASSLPTLSPTTGKKRNRKKKKNAAQKRAKNQLAVSAMFPAQVPSFSAQ